MTDLPSNPQLVTVFMPIGELLERGMKNVFRVRVNGRGASLMPPHKRPDGTILCHERTGYNGSYVATPDAIAEVAFTSPAVLEAQAQDIRDLMTRYAK